MCKSNRKLIRRSLLALICLAALYSACAPLPPPSPALTPITVQLAWTHNAQFAGLYAADQLGYYASEGLAVTFNEGGPGVDQIAAVLPSAGSGQAQFSVSVADVLLLARAAGKPVRAIAAIYRRSPRVYIALADSGITRPQDFVGRIISVNPAAQASFEAMMKRLDIQPDQYTLVDSTSDLSSFYSGEVQVRSVYLTNEVLAIRAAGYKINIIYPDDYGIHNYGDTLVCSDDLIASQPGLVLRFVRASLRGWTYALENPSETGAMVVHYNPAADPALESSKITASIPLVNTGEDFIGWMRLEIWDGMQQTLREQGVLTAPLDMSQVFTLQFLEEIYK